MFFRDFGQKERARGPKTDHLFYAALENQKVNVNFEWLIQKNYSHHDSNISHKGPWWWTSFNHVTKIMLGDKSLFDNFQQKICQFRGNSILVDCRKDSEASVNRSLA